MSRIDAALATQVGESSRPIQTTHDARLQSDAAQVRSSDAATNESVGADELRAAATQVQQVVQTASGRRMIFKIDQATDDVYVQIQDEGTGEVIAQLPSKEVLKLRANLDQMLGVLFDKRA